MRVKLESGVISYQLLSQVPSFMGDIDIITDVKFTENNEAVIKELMKEFRSYVKSKVNVIPENTYNAIKDICFFDLLDINNSFGFSVTYGGSILILKFAQDITIEIKFSVYENTFGDVSLCVRLGRLDMFKIGFAAGQFVIRCNGVNGES